jgi:hypothetical protein
MEILVIVLAQNVLPLSTLLSLYDTCKAIRFHYGEFTFTLSQSGRAYYGLATIKVGRFLPWTTIARCVRYFAIAHSDVDVLCTVDLMNLLLAHNYLAEAEVLRIGCQLLKLDFLDGIASNGRYDLAWLVSSFPDHLVPLQKRIFEKLRIPMTSMELYEHFNAWHRWTSGNSPVAHMYTFLAKTMLSRSIVALEWCLSKFKLSTARQQGWFSRSPRTWLDTLLEKQKFWPNLIRMIKAFADEWGHPKALELANKFD